MAKNYKRHSQGKGFRKSDFGDMGLRAYREQQNTIINSLKLQNKEFESTRKEFIDSDILKTIKEEKNRTELKKLEDDVYDVKFENTRIRAEREIEALEHEAKEKEQESKFWVDFSSTYAQQYAKAAQDIHGAIDLKRAENSINQYVNSGEYAQNIENSDMLDKLNSAEMQTIRHKISTGKDVTPEELHQFGAQFEDIKQRKWSTRNEGIIAKYKEDWEKIRNHALQTIGERISIDKNNIDDILIIRGLELLKQAGIPEHSKAGVDFLKFVRNKAYDEVYTKSKRHDIKQGEENKKAASGRVDTAIKSGDKYKMEFALNDLGFLLKNELVESDGKFDVIQRNEKEVLLETVSYLSKAGIVRTTDQIDAILQSPFPGQTFPTLMGKNVGVKDLAKIDTRTSWETRYEGTDLRDTLIKVHSEAETKRNKEKEKIKNTTDRGDKAEINAGISKKPDEEGYINLRDENQMKTLDAKYQGRGNGKAYEYLQELKILGNIGVNDDGYILNADAITALAEEGKLTEFKRIIGLQSEKTQDLYTKMIEGYEFAERVGWDKKGRTDHLKTALSRISGLEDVTKLPADSDYNMMFEDAEQVFLNLINKYDHRTDLNDVQKKQAIADDLRDLIGEKPKDEKLSHGSSIFRRRVIGGKIQWMAYRKEKGNRSSDKEINKLAELGTENFLNTQKNEKTRLTIFDQEELDTLEKSNLTGATTFPIPKRVKDLVNTLWKQQNKKDTTVFKTETMILNELLEAQGSKFAIQPLAEDMNLFKAKKYEVLIPNYLQMSREDQERITCAQTILNLADTDECKKRIAKDEEAERIRQEFEKIRLEFIQRSKDRGILLQEQYED